MRCLQPLEGWSDAEMAAVLLPLQLLIEQQVRTHPRLRCAAGCKLNALPCLLSTHAMYVVCHVVACGPSALCWSLLCACRRGRASEKLHLAGQQLL